MTDLGSLFRSTVDPVEIVVRGSLMYWFLFALFRWVLRRDVGSIAIADVLLLVLIADASQNAMSGGYESVGDGCILVATIAGWNYLLDWSSFHFKPVRRLVEPPPLLLVRDGVLLRKNMRKELVSLDELKSKLREQGIEHFDEIRRAYMEANGEISVLRRKSEDAGPEAAAPASLRDRPQS